MRAARASHLSVVGALAACSGGAGTGPTTPPVPAPAPCPGGSAATLEAPGDEPRVARRYQYTAGRTDTFVATARGSMDYVIDGQQGEAMPAPGFELVATMKVDAIEADGAATISFDVERGAWDTGVAGDDAMLAGSIAHIADASGTLAIDPCGRVRSTVWTLPAAAGVQVRPRLELAMVAMGRLRPVLPSEPIGVGATWSTTAPIDESGMKSTETLRYELTAVSEAGSLTIRVGLVADAAPQTLPPSDLYPIPPEIVSSRSEGEGNVTIDPAALVPVNGAVKVRNTLDMKVRDSQGKSHRVGGSSTLVSAIERRSTAPL